METDVLVVRVGPIGLPTTTELRRLYDVAVISAYLRSRDGYIGYRGYPIRLDRSEVYLRCTFHP
jgi:hypothetical protein